MVVKLLKNKYPVISGIYKINFPNEKSYIGQSRNIYKRINEHNNYALYGHGSHSISACELAIKKYGLVTDFEILEEVQDYDLLDEKEEFYIQKYETYKKEKGYNIVRFGNASNKSGTDHCLAAFSQEQIEEIYDLLKNHLEITQKQIADRYNVNEVTISRINLGKNYVNKNLIYPLRPSNNKEFLRKTTVLDYNITEENVLMLKEDLKYDWELKIENDLVNKYNLPLSVIRDINQGKLFADIGQYEYPIRDRNFINRSKTLTKIQIKEIIQDLRKGLTKVAISKKYNISRHLVLRIQEGRTYRLKEEHYPI